MPGAHQAFRAAVTSLCISALIETGGDGAEVARAVDRGEAWLLRALPPCAGRRPMPLQQLGPRLFDRRPWRTCSSPRRRPGPLPQDPRPDRGSRSTYWAATSASTAAGAITTSTLPNAEAQRLDDELRHRRRVGGLQTAKDAGVEVPQRLIDRGMASILRQRKPDFSYRLRRISQVSARCG